MNEKGKFDAMRFVAENPGKTEEVVRAMEEGLPTEGIRRKTEIKNEPVPLAKPKHWMKKLEDREDGVEN